MKMNPLSKWLMMLFKTVSDDEYNAYVMSKISIRHYDDAYPEIADVKVTKATHQLKGVTILNWTFVFTQGTKVVLTLSKSDSELSLIKGGSGKLSISDNEVNQYLAISGDYNDIHRGPNAIIPGLLLLHYFEEYRQNTKGIAQIRFRCPLKVNQAYYIEENTMKSGVHTIMSVVVS